jgi:hypothetical protein
MSNGPLKRIMGVMGDRVRLAEHAEELHLFVNGSGQVLALSPEQIEQRTGLHPTAATPDQPPQPEQPAQPAPSGYQQTDEGQ